MSREQIEKLYQELLADARLVPKGSVAEERLDAQLVLLETMLDAPSEKPYNEPRH
jgi:hypothetical protein